jgi:hypothetical protein
VVIAHGQWILAINLYFGLVVGLIGLGCVLVSIKLIFVTTVKDVLFRIADSRATPPGMKVHIYRLIWLTGVLSKVLLYTLLAIAILLMSVMSVTRYTHVPLNLEALPK